MLHLLHESKSNPFRVDILNELAWSLRKSESQRAESYADWALSLSDTLQYHKGYITGMNRKGMAIFYQKNYEEALRVYLQILELEKQDSHNHYGIGRAHNQLSKILKELGNYPLALSHSMKALEIFDSLGYGEISGTVLITQGILLEANGKFRESLECFLKALEIGQNHQNKEIEGFALMNLGDYSISTKNYSKAIDYLNQSLVIFEDFHDKIELAKLFNSLGIAYFHLGYADSALAFYNKSMEFSSQLSARPANPNLFNNLGALFVQKGELEKALEYYQESLKVFEEQTGQPAFIASYSNIGDIYYKKEEYDLAIQYYKNGLDLAEKSNQKLFFSNLLNGLSLAHFKLGNYKTSLGYRNQYQAYNDSLESSYRESVKLKERYLEELQKKEILQKEKEIVLAENAQITIIVWALAFGLLLVIVLFFVLFKNYRQRKRLQLSEKDKLIAQKEKLEILANQEKEFNYARLEGQDKERDRIARDLHDRIGSILSMVKLNYQFIQDELASLKLKTMEKYQEANSLLDEACNEVRKIAYDINSGMIAKFGLIAAIDDLARTLENKSNINIEFTNSGIDDPFPNEMEISIFRIVQELVSNILNHANASEIDIQFIFQDENV